MNNVDCVGCHQLGQESTRTIPAQFGQFKSGADAWIRRVAVRPVRRVDDQPARRPARRRAVQVFRRLDRPRRQGRIAEAQAAAAVGCRTQRRRHHLGLVDAGQVPARPDLVGPAQSDGQRQRPALRRAGVLDRQHADPRSEDAQGVVLQDAGSRSEHAGIARTAVPRQCAVKPTQPSAYWGDEMLWDTKANQHNAMFDKKGRVWLAATVRGMDNPAWCKKGSEHPSAKVFPLDRSPRQVAMLDPKTMKYSFIDTCFGTHHPQFGYDADNTLWLSGSGPVAGWVNTKVWDETGDAQKAVGLVPVRARHQRQRQARRVHRAGQAGGRQGHALQSGLRALCGDAASDRRLDLVHLRRVRRHGRASCASIRRPSSASSTLCRRKASACAAATSARTACCGAPAPPAI